MNLIYKYAPTDCNVLTVVLGDTTAYRTEYWEQMRKIVFIMYILDTRSIMRTGSQVISAIHLVWYRLTHLHILK